MASGGGLALRRPHRVDGLRRIGCDLDIGAVVISVPTGIIETVVRHELHDLETAFPAVDVWQPNVGLPRFHFTGRPRPMNE